MAQVVMCHGIGYQYKHRETALMDWYSSLRRGMHDAAHPAPPPDKVDAVYYGNCYRSLGTKSAEPSALNEFARIPPIGPMDVRDPVELSLLASFAEGTEGSKAGGKGWIQDSLRKIQGSERFGKPPARLVLWLVRQVRRYLDPTDTVRACALERFERVVTSRTRVIIGHSLGSVVAYEALCAHPEWRIDTFITLGSPLGLAVIRDRLDPPRWTGDLHVWPHVRRWVNVAAKEDPVALVKELRPFFGPQVIDRPVQNTGLPKYILGGHSVLRYLTTAEVADGVAESLRTI